MVLSAPTNVISIPLNIGQYYFQWDTVPGALSYNVEIYRLSYAETGHVSSPDVGVILYSENTTNRFVIASGIENMLTRITITSVNNTESASTIIVKDAAGVLEPMSSVGFTATPYDSAIKIDITPLSYAVSPIVYRVFKSSSGRLSPLISTTGTSVIISGLTNGTTYNIQVHAYYNGVHIGTYVNTTGLQGISGIKSTPTAGTSAPSIPVVNTALSTFTVNGLDAYDGSIFTLPTSTAAVTAVATPYDSNATVQITGDTGLVSGFNTLTVTVTSGGVTSTYTVTLYVTPAVAAVCFLGDAPVLTPAGYRPIRDIEVGDSVTTADGRTVAVKRVFSRPYTPSAAVNPYVIPKGFLGATRSFAISPNHEVQVPGRGMVKARDLGLRRMKMAGEFVYYNLELEDWVQDNLVVAGVTVESLAPIKRITMTKAEFMKFVKGRYTPSAAARLRSVCFEEDREHVSMPALM